MVKLKNCPCCNSDRARMALKKDFGLQWWYVYCVDCGIRTMYHMDVETAEKVWNRRDYKDSEDTPDASGGINDGE